MAHIVCGGGGLTCLLGVLQSGVPVVGVEAGLNPASHGPRAVYGLPCQVNVLSEEVIQHCLTRRAERHTSSTCTHEPQEDIAMYVYVHTYMYVQWNLSIVDTIGTQLVVLYTVEPLYGGHHWDPAVVLYAEVSLIQR